MKYKITIKKYSLEKKKKKKKKLNTKEIVNVKKPYISNHVHSDHDGPASGY